MTTSFDSSHRFDPNYSRNLAKFEAILAMSTGPNSNHDSCSRASSRQTSSSIINSQIPRSSAEPFAGYPEFDGLDEDDFRGRPRNPTEQRVFEWVNNRLNSESRPNSGEADLEIKQAQEVQQEKSRASDAAAALLNALHTSLPIDPLASAMHSGTECSSSRASTPPELFMLPSRHNSDPTANSGLPSSTSLKQGYGICPQAAHLINGQQVYEDGSSDGFACSASVELSTHPLVVTCQETPFSRRYSMSSVSRTVTNTKFPIITRPSATKPRVFTMLAHDGRVIDKSAKRNSSRSDSTSANGSGSRSSTDGKSPKRRMTFDQLYHSQMLEEAHAFKLASLRNSSADDSE
ncbi:hypothetical protein CANCADRAFT_2718 [Tortispora caseinolytica NRRL Y-17796]|uniref:Uncharacterized protein n=1 Tax=Tortispora caseinolytica NRRL Y-17796 TaxID=767744 RepID=A0A1E4TH39_9ASCO|nr:hypothetical protein CANCADRAFT_2718 [Tortispora caseinolytica NRRL Y-17796]